MASIPSDLKYTKSHEWLKEEGDAVAIGLTDYAQDALGDLVFVNLPEEGDEVTAGEACADVESVKAVSDVYSPVTGTVEAINEELIDSPELINEKPYEAWFIKVGDITEHDDLLDAAAYEKFCDEEA
jgi:glycine cleavage system H protein